MCSAVLCQSDSGWPRRLRVLRSPQDGCSIRLPSNPALGPSTSVADRLGVINLLSERVGTGGLVVGVEREPRFFEMARTEQHERGLRNVQLVNADAVNTGLEKDSYDVVHERLVLINIPLATQQAILTEMLSRSKLGGTIAIEEFDFVSFACDPDHPSWNILFTTWCDAFHAAGGGNLFIGRSLARLLRSAGAENVRIHGHANLPPVGEYQRTHIL